MASLESRTTAANRRKSSAARRSSVMSTKVTTTPSIQSSSVRYGRTRRRNQAPLSVRTSDSWVARSAKTRRASSNRSSPTKRAAMSLSGRPVSGGDRLRRSVAEGHEQQSAAGKARFGVHLHAHVDDAVAALDAGLDSHRALLRHRAVQRGAQLDVEALA